MDSPSRRLVGGFGFDARQKLRRGDDELFVIAGEHDRRLAGGERRPAHDFVAAAVKFDVLPDGESAQPDVVGDGLDSFHNTDVHITSERGEASVQASQGNKLRNAGVLIDKVGAGAWSSTNGR